MITHELEEDFSAQLSRGDSRWWCTCGKWSTPIWHTPHAVREHEVHVREVEGRCRHSGDFRIQGTDAYCCKCGDLIGLAPL